MPGLMVLFLLIDKLPARLKQADLAQSIQAVLHEQVLETGCETLGCKHC